jgi:pilus assembly protein CpaF
MTKKEFRLSDWKTESGDLCGEERRPRGDESFSELCDAVARRFQKEWEAAEKRENLLELQKKAIMGYEEEKGYFLARIRSFLKESGISYIDYPDWYSSPEEAVYHELWGLAGMAEWFSDEWSESSSAKIIGDRVYFMRSGRMIKRPQTISKERRSQLVRALLLNSPKEKTGRDYYEVYMPGGTRVTAFRNGIVKDGEDVIIFRRYVVKRFNFEEQAMRGSIDLPMIDRFKEMVKRGVSVAFVGEIRSGKTTFLSTWQSYEDPEIEGVLIETDPEIPIHEIMPDAPIVQIVADGERMENIVKSLMRSDAQYFCFGEARDGIALNTALRIAERGGRRMKMTFHITNPFDFPFDVANEIAFVYGGSVAHHALRAASAFEYILHFGTGKNLAEKKLLGIYHMEADKAEGKIRIECECLYDAESESWIYSGEKLKTKEYTIYGLESKR